MYRDQRRPTTVDVTAHDERSMRVLEIVISFAAIASVVILALPR
jgi:hypothetical protein